MTTSSLIVYSLSGIMLQPFLRREGLFLYKMSVFPPNNVQFSEGMGPETLSCVVISSLRRHRMGVEGTRGNPKHAAPFT